VNKSYNFDKKYQFGKWRVEVDTSAAYGWFQHDESGTEGGMWFERISYENDQGFKLELVDFDGRFMFPKPIYEGLKAEPEFSIDEVFDPNYDPTKE